MKRDMDLCRKILFKLESDGSASPEDQIEGYSAIEIGYHCYLLHDAGLAAGSDCAVMCDEPGQDYPQWTLSRLTWAGHEFIELSRDSTLWKKVTAKLKEKTGSLGFEAVKVALSEGIKAVAIQVGIAAASQ